MQGLGVFVDGFHDSNIALSDDKGTIIKAAAEERLSRVIQDGNTPFQCFQWVNEAQLNPNYFVTPGCSLQESIEVFRNCGKPTDSVVIFNNLRESKLKKLGLDRKERIFVPHLLSHASSAFFCSRFDEAYVFIADGGNVWDPWTCALYHGKGTKLTCIDIGKNEFTDLYMFATALLGFKPNRHEGKLTGLASYQEENLQLREKFAEFRAHYLDSGLTLSSKYLSWKDIYTNPHLEVNYESINEISKSLPPFTREQIAYEAQYITEKDAIEYLKKHLPNFDLPICLAGGLFNNIKLNLAILTTGFPQIYIHPAMGDVGLSVGCLAYANSLEGNRNYLENVCLGPSFSDDEIIRAFIRQNLDYERVENVEEYIAQCIVEGKIIGRMNGKLEYGPRALGNRSILCNAQNSDQIKRLNDSLKRDEFMPFAPAILEEQFKECVKNWQVIQNPSLWMTIACESTQVFKDFAPELVHVDNTIRPQCVSKRLYPSFYRIIEVYYEKTGIPAILNTSFNMHGEPIVCSPEDAILTFIKAKLDVLVIQNYVVKGK